MKKLIHDFLNSNFSVKINLVIGENGVPCRSNKVSQTLTLVFAYSRKELKWYIKSWIKKQDKSFDFNKWWSKTTFNVTCSHEIVQDIYGIDVLAQELALEIDTQIIRDLFRFENNIAFPLIRRVAAQTIGLVSVQSLPAPSGLPPFLDYQYGIDPVDNNQGYVFERYIPVETTPVAYTGSPMHELTTRYAAREVNPNYYGRINVSGGTGTTTDLEKNDERNH